MWHDVARKIPWAGYSMGSLIKEGFNSLRWLPMYACPCVPYERERESERDHDNLAKVLLHEAFLQFSIFYSAASSLLTMIIIKTVTEESHLTVNP